MSRALFYYFGPGAAGIGTPAVISGSLSSIATGRSDLGANLDQLIDPLTLDYVDTDDGEWLETADSRTMVMCQIEMRLGEDFAAPDDGTRIKALLEDPDFIVTPAVVVAETRRALQVLVDAGIIGELDFGATEDTHGNMIVDEAGRFVLALSWRDLASGSPVDLVYSPFER